MKQLKELRELYGWTQEDLSYKLEVSIDTVKGWERKTNPNHPGIKNRFKLNQLLMKAGIEKILPTAKEVDDLLADPDIYNKVSDIIIDSSDLGNIDQIVNQEEV